MKKKEVDQRYPVRLVCVPRGKFFTYSIVMCIAFSFRHFFIDAVAAFQLLLLSRLQYEAVVCKQHEKCRTKKKKTQKKTKKKKHNNIDWISHRSAFFDVDIVCRLRFYWMDRRTIQYAIKRNRKKKHNLHLAVQIVCGCYSIGLHRHRWNHRFSKSVCMYIVWNEVGYRMQIALSTSRHLNHIKTM